MVRRLLANVKTPNVSYDGCYEAVAARLRAAVWAARHRRGSLGPFRA